MVLLSHIFSHQQSEAYVTRRICLHDYMSELLQFGEWTEI